MVYLLEWVAPISIIIAKKLPSQKFRVWNGAMAVFFWVILDYAPIYLVIFIILNLVFPSHEIIWNKNKPYFVFTFNCYRPYISSHTPIPKDYFLVGPIWVIYYFFLHLCFPFFLRLVWCWSELIW